MKSIGRLFLRGSLIGLIIVVFVVLTTGKVSLKEIASLLLPLLAVTLAGGTGSLVFALNDAEKYREKWQKSLALTINVLVYTLLIIIAFSFTMKGFI